MSYTLGIPISQQRRANKVLRHDLSEPIDFEVSKQDKDFYIFTFNVDYDEFKKLVVFLKSNGVTTIGADKQLTERKIMKLTRLIEQDIKNGSPGSSITGMEDSPSQGFKKPNNLSTADDIIDELKYILKVWETKEYNSDKERYEEYFMDIEDLVTDFEENRTLDTPDVSDVGLEESKHQLKDFFINEQKTYGDLSPEEWEAEREKSGYEMKTDVEGNQYIDFKYDGGNEPLEIQMNPDQGEYANKIFYIEPEDIEAYVNGEDVEAIRPDAGFGEPDEVTANKNNSDVTDVGELNENEKDLEKAIIDVLKKEGGAAGLEPILAIASKLGVTKSQIKKVLNSISKIKKHTNGDYILTPIEEGHCTEEEIAEGTCGHGVNGKIGRKPAGPSLMDFFKDE